MSEKVTITGTLSFAHSLEDDPVSDAEGISGNRWDLSAGAVYFFNSRATLYASMGRTISHIDVNAATFTFAAGVSFGFQHRIGGPDRGASGKPPRP